MKSKDKTKQKKHESTIGKIIYGFLLFMPLLAIGVTCAYAIFNKNAYQSYSGNETTQTTYINNRNNFVVNEKYYFNSRNYTSLTNVATMGNSTRLMFNNFDIISTNIDAQNIENTTQLAFYKSSATATSLSIYLYDELGTLIFSGATSNYFLHCSFDFLSNNISNTLFENTNMFYKISNFAGNYIDNVFYYSIDKVQQSPLFNWAEDSAIYTGMAATCNALDISTTFIPLIMTYWLVISVIYFLYDIILIILHVFHRKIHELEESI